MNEHFAKVLLIFLILLSNSFESMACLCAPYPNRSLCQLGDEANAGAISNFMAVVKLTNEDSINYGAYRYSVNVIEMLAGNQPNSSIELFIEGGASCSQHRVIDDNVVGVLVANLVDSVAYPTFCLLERSFFRLSNDTVYRNRFDTNPSTLSDFRANDCPSPISNTKESNAFEDNFSLTYNWQLEELHLASSNPTIRSETLSIHLYSSNGQHLLEAQPAGPIDVNAFPPGMYAILIRDDQRAWSKAFVKPN